MAKSVVTPTSRILEHALGTTGLPNSLKSQARIVFADPPYNIGVGYSEDTTRDRLPEAEYFFRCERWISELSELCMPFGTFWWLCPPGHSDTIGPMLTRLVGPRMYMVIKRESFAQYQKKKLTEDYRILFCHVKWPSVGSAITTPAAELSKEMSEAVVFNPDAIREKSVRQEMGDPRADPAGRVPGQVWDIRRLQGTSTHRVDWHPAQLAPELLQRIVLGWSHPGELVVDGFAGSGNMGAVCHSLGRWSLLVEQSAEYCSRIIERLKTQPAKRFSEPAWEKEWHGF